MILQKEAMVADMHTHSEHSHDSVCPIEEMCRAQIARGTRVMAVTDHFDTASFRDYDIYSPIIRAYEEVQELNTRMNGEIELLSGVEISELFWFPAEHERIITAVPYDVVIGSVHLVQYHEHRAAYSGMDFSRFSPSEIEAYLHVYFDDMMTMLETMDFDVLAHLTCPLRYITGKYGIAVDLSHFEVQTEEILKRVIETGRSLELNTSSYRLLGGFMPDDTLLQRYLALGGKRITIGSDAHVSENASGYFEEALAYLRARGVRELYYYKQRKPVAYSI